jgi:uncharacterized membrane protein
VAGRMTVICTGCGLQADAGEQFCRGCGSFLEWTAAPSDSPASPPSVVPAPTRARPANGLQPAVSGPPVVAMLADRRVAVVPGTDVSAALEVHNRGRTVDQLTLEITGPAAAWSTVSPRRLNLLPGTSATATITCRPPRTPASTAGAHAAAVAVRSSEHSDEIVSEPFVVDVGEFTELDAELSPRVMRGVRDGTARVTLSNRGNVPFTVALSGDDPELAFAIQVSPRELRTDPGMVTTAAIAVTAHETLPPGQADRTRPFRILLGASDGTKRVLDGTFIQVAPPPPPAVVDEPGPVVMLSATTLRVMPGGQAEADASILNRGRRVVQLSLAIVGPAAAWLTVEPGRLNLPPNTWAKASIACRPPRAPTTRPGPYNVELVVRSRECAVAAATEAIAEAIVVEVGSFVELVSGLSPTVLTGPREASTRLNVVNSGNVAVEIALTAEDPAMALEFRISPATLHVGPGTVATATVAARPRGVWHPATSVTWPFRVVLAAGGLHQLVEGAFTHPAAPRGHRVLALIAFVILTFVVFVAGDLTGYLVEWPLGVKPPEVSVVAACVVWGGGLLLAFRRSRRIWRGY